jgi:hypothetical protein
MRRSLMIVTLSCALTPLAWGEFRVNPYLQQPSSDGMLFTWFTTTNTPGSIQITGPGLASPLSLGSSPTREIVLDYTTGEDVQTISGLSQGSWLVGGPGARDNNYKHSVDVRALQPGQTYTYTVTQGDQAYTREFRTAPTRTDWQSVRFVAMSDSEIEPLARTQRTQWAPGAGGQSRPAADSAFATKFGTATLNGATVLRYPLTESEGFKRNLNIVDSRNPDFVVMPGDIVQGGGYQPGWDEFFRHQAGEFGDNLSKRPLIAAMGNWEVFATGVNGGYSTNTEANPLNNGPRFGRMKYKSYIDAPSNGTDDHQDNYHRVDYGPVTIITLDSTNGGLPGGMNEDRRANYPAGTKLTGQQYTGPGTDTQENFTVDAYNATRVDAGYERYDFDDLSDFNPGSTQWNWARQQLADARAAGQIVFVQFHHAPYSDGEHGLPMNHAASSGQGGTPMRQYHSMFEQFGVAAVLSGHSEMFERSFVDENGDGVGVNYYDVGVSADGLRGERRVNEVAGADFYTRELLNYNPFSQWTADQSEAEQWELVDGVLQLVDGGKHYGHLEVNVERISSEVGDLFAQITLTPVYSFPVLDSEYNLLRTERRVYGDEIVLLVNADGRVVPEPATLGLIAGVALLALRRR